MRLFDMDSKEDYLLDGKYKVATPYTPCVDVVEVVRCKDCKHYVDAGTIPNKSCCGFCTKLGAVSYYGVDATDYCSFGERKEP